jgi:hypothetical protein
VAACGLKTTLRVARAFISPSPAKASHMNDGRTRFDGIHQ